MKRLYFDLEVSPNIVLAWTAGYKLNITHDQIIKERAIICVSYKWEGKSAHSISWDKGCDKKLLEKFIPIALQADEIIAHNGDRFDIKWMRTRALLHGVDCPDFKSVDTLKQAKAAFKFNSNRLDYIAKFLGLGGKSRTEYDWWKKILLDNCKESLKNMVHYCERDVEILEEVHKKFLSYVPQKTHVGVLQGGEKWSCEGCGSVNVKVHMTRVTAKGTESKLMRCKDCSKMFTISIKSYTNLLLWRNDQLRRKRENPE